MPKYDYKCPVCGRTKEIQHAFREKIDLACPNSTCSALLERQFTPNGNFILKGPGFYSTDSPQGRLKRTIVAEDNAAKPQDGFSK